MLFLGEAAVLAGVSVDQLLGSCQGSCACTLPESLGGFPLPPFLYQQGILQLLAAVKGTSNSDVYAKPHLHKLLLPQKMNV